MARDGESNETNDGGIRPRQWQIEEVKQALAETDRGDFASDEEVERMFDELTRPVWT